MLFRSKIEEKNTDSGVEKKVKNTEDKTIGDAVDYEINVEIVKGAVNYVVSDTMGTGLDYEATTLKVQLITTSKTDETKTVTDLTQGTEYTLTAENELNGKIFEIKFDNTFLANNESDVTETNTIQITYSATITKDAIIESEIGTDDEGNTWNQATLNYGNNKHVDTPKHNADVDLYKITINKVDSNGTGLPGAEFKLYDGNQKAVEVIKVTPEEGTPYYRPIVAGETATDIVVDESGVAVVKGLADGTY